MKETIAIIAAIIAVVGNVPYLLDIIRKRVQPHPYTWLVWTVVSGVMVFGQIAKGAGIGVLPTAASELFTITIFILSLRYGFRNIKKIDTYFLLIALLGLIPWALTKDPTVSVVIVVGIDLVAFVPTLRKTWRQPKTETPVLYGMNVLRHVLTLFSLQAYNVATMLHSVTMIVTNTMMTSFILFKKQK